MEMQIDKHPQRQRNAAPPGLFPPLKGKTAKQIHRMLIKGCAPPAPTTHPHREKTSLPKNLHPRAVFKKKPPTFAKIAGEFFK